MDAQFILDIFFGWLLGILSVLFVIALIMINDKDLGNKSDKE